MFKSSRSVVLVSGLIALLLQSSCGDSDSGHEEVKFAEQTSLADKSASILPEAVGTEHCTENAPVDDAPQTYCKSLPDGTVHSVTLKPSTYVQDPETCVITVVDDGLKTTLLEMQFDLCGE